MSIRRLSNLFRRKDKKYKSKVNHGEVTCETLLASHPNIGHIEYNGTDINTIFDHIVIKLTYDTYEYTGDSIDLLDKAIMCNIYYWFYIDDKTDISYIYLSSNSYDMRRLVNEFKLNNIRNEFIILIDNEIKSYWENAFCNDTDISFRLIDNNHECCIKRITDDIDNIEIIGYTWFEDDMLGRELLYNTNCVWLMIPDYYINDLCNIIKSSYNMDNGLYLIKMKIYDFINLLTDGYSTISKELYDTIKKIISGDIEYYDHISPMNIFPSIDIIDESEFEEDDTEVIDDDEDEEEITQEEFINKALDEIVK